MTKKFLKESVAMATAISMMAVTTAASAADLRPSQAVTNTAAPASHARAKLGKSNKLAPAILIGVLATVAIVGGAVIIANEDDNPDSP